MRTISGTLLTAQSAGFPTGGYQPAVSCLFRPCNTGISGTTTYDYSFNPAVTTNVVEHIQQVEERFSDHGIVIINNRDRSVPDLKGYYVDLGWGLKTGAAATANTYSFAPTMWVMNQTLVSGAPKDSMPQLYTVLELQGAWGAVLGVQPIRYGVSPYFRDESEALANQTIYGCMSILVSQLNLQCGTIAGTATFSIAGSAAASADGIIANTAYAPFKAYSATALIVNARFRIADTSGGADFITVGAAVNTVGTEFIASSVAVTAGAGTAVYLRLPYNDNTPTEFETYGGYFRRLLQDTKCVLRCESALVLKVVFAQTSDAVDETYYSSSTAGHGFYRALDTTQNMVPNHIIVTGVDYSVIPPTPTISGDWYDPDHYSGTAYNGTFMPVVRSYHQESLSTSAACSTLALTLGMELKHQMAGGNVIIPMDASVELYDKVKMVDTR